MENPNELTKLARHSNRYVRAAVASNRYTPFQVLDELSCDSDIGVRASVAGNTTTRILTLATLGMKTSVCDPYMWPIFLCLAGNSAMTRGKILERIYLRKEWAECLQLVNNPSTSAVLLKKLSKETDPDWEIITWLAQKRLAK